MPRSLISPDSILMAHCRPGTVFYSEKEAKDITSIAVQHSRKVTTEKLFAIKSISPDQVKVLTRVTIIE